MKKYIDNIVYMTPKEGKRVVAVFLFGVWTEIYAGEVIMVHKKHMNELLVLDMVIVENIEYPILHKTMEEAENTPSKFKVFRGV